MITLKTVGHGTLPGEVFASLLHGAHVGRVVDIRSFPGSRHNPQFGRECDAPHVRDGAGPGGRIDDILAYGQLRP